MLRRTNRESGQVMPLIGVVMAILVIAALAMGQATKIINTKARAQTAADAAALAGVAGGVPAARSAARANGATVTKFANTADGVVVTVDLGDQKATSAAASSGFGN